MNVQKISYSGTGRAFLDSRIVEGKQEGKAMISCFFSFFGGGQSPSSLDIFNGGFFGSNDEQGPSYNEETSGFSGTDSDGPVIDAPQVAVLHNPEPGSMILFGSGLAGLGLFRRRRFRKSSK